MYMQNDIAATADAVAKGPTIDAPRIEPAVRQAEIDYILAVASAALPKTALRKLGGLSLAAASEDNAQSYFAADPVGTDRQFGVRVPLSDPPARDTGRQDLDATVAKVVEAASQVAPTGPKLRKYAALIRDMAEETIAPATGGIARMRIAAIGVTRVSSEGAVSTTIDVEMLGCDLTSGIERVTERDTDNLEVKLAKLVAAHLERRKALAQAKAAGASGWIDDAALRIIDAAGFDRADVVAMVRSKREVEFSYGGEDGYEVSGALGWRNGVIEGFAETALQRRHLPPRWASADDRDKGTARHRHRRSYRAPPARGDRPAADPRERADRRRQRVGRMALPRAGDQPHHDRGGDRPHRLGPGQLCEDDSSVSCQAHRCTAGGQVLTHGNSLTTSESADSGDLTSRPEPRHLRKTP